MIHPATAAGKENRDQLVTGPGPPLPGWPSSLSPLAGRLCPCGTHLLTTVSEIWEGIPGGWGGDEGGLAQAGRALKREEWAWDREGASLPQQNVAEQAGPHTQPERRLGLLPDHPATLWIVNSAFSLDTLPTEPESVSACVCVTLIDAFLLKK